MHVLKGVTPHCWLLQAPKVVRKAPNPKPAGFELGFTKDNEVFVGRLAMLGFASSVVGEVRNKA